MQVYLCLLWCSSAFSLQGEKKKENIYIYIFWIIFNSDMKRGLASHRAGFRNGWRNLIHFLALRNVSVCMRLLGCVSPSKSLSFGSEIRGNVRCCVCGRMCDGVCMCKREREWEGMKVRFCSETFDVIEQCLLSVCQLPALYHHPNTWPPQSVYVCLFFCARTPECVCVSEREK